MLMHEPSVSSGNTLEEKIAIAENPDNIRFLEEADHIKRHQELGGTQTRITEADKDMAYKALMMMASGLELLNYIPDPTMIVSDAGCATLTPCE